MADTLQYIVFGTGDPSLVAIKGDNNTFTGNNIFSGTNTFSNNGTYSGLNTFSTTNTFQGTTHFGGTSNYIEITENGNMQMFGSATMWDDIAVTVSNVRLPVANAPTWTDFVGGQVLAFSESGDEIIYFSCQIPHGYKTESNIEFHIHTVCPNDGTGSVLWNFTYSWAALNEVFGSATTVSTAIPSSGTAGLHKLDEIINAIDGTGKGISSVLLCSLQREGSGTADTYGTSIYLTSLDFHIEKDTLGSDEETSK